MKASKTQNTGSDTVRDNDRLSILRIWANRSIVDVDKNPDKLKRLSARAKAKELKKAKRQKEPNSKLQGQKNSESDDENDDDEDEAHDNGDDGPSGSRGLDYSRAPVSHVRDIFKILCDKACEKGLQEACSAFSDRSLRIFTMCSGTESPVLAMNLLQRALEHRGIYDLNFHHVASAEIESWKAAFIERNFSPPIIYRDVTEFALQQKQLHTVYGSLAPPPEHVDIVVAGASCVDYSNLNKSVKKFGKPGESNSTMQGVLAYCIHYQPNLVILENVKGAPWPQVAWLYEHNGYDTCVIKVDSKNYLVPQTRQRGYMFAINRAYAKKIGFDTKKGRQTWIDCMDGFQHRASAPYTSFIYSEGDQRLEEQRKLIEGSIQPPSRSQDWANCRNRYATRRSQWKIGFERPFTMWQENGSASLPDSGWQKWGKNQRERVMDTIDIDLLKFAIQREYDLSHKHRVLDVSQNIDRDTDNKLWGIISCLTPSGMFFESFRCGVISGEECMRLQGLPVDELVIKKETSKQLQDLSGNAMTCPVVGSAMISAIIAATQASKKGKKISMLHDIAEVTKAKAICPSVTPTEKRQRLLAREPKELISSWENQYQLQQMNQPLTSHLNLKLGRYQGLTNKAPRLCTCEGVFGKKEAQIRMCQDCGHTACIGCAGNPVHKYGDLPSGFLKKRIDPEKFIAQIEDSLPRSLQFSLEDKDLDLILDQLDPFTGQSAMNTPAEDNEDKMDVDYANDAEGKKETKSAPAGSKQSESARFRRVVRSALKGCYRFEGLKRDSSWRIEFSSLHGRLELRMTPSIPAKPSQIDSADGKVRIRWYLYATCDLGESLGSKVRAHLAEPIAVLDLNKKGGLLSGEWKMCAPAKKQVRVHVRGSKVQTDSWQSRLRTARPEFKRLRSFAELELTFESAINTDCLGLGPKFQLPKTLTFKHLPDCGNAEASLYRAGVGGQPLYLFLDPEPLKDARHDCYVIALDHSRRVDTSPRSVLLKFPKMWRPNRDEGVTLDEATDCDVIHNLVGVNSIELDRTPSEQEIISWLPSDEAYLLNPALNCADAGLPILGVRLPMLEQCQDYYKSGNRYVLQLVDRGSDLTPYNFELKAMTPPKFAQQWVDLFAKHQLSLDDLVHKDGDGCVPKRPHHDWRVVRLPRSGQTAVLPVEHVKHARQYEQQLKERPDVVFATINCDKEYAYLELGMNLKTLAHRCLAPFAGSKDKPSLRFRILRSLVVRKSSPFAIDGILNNTGDDLCLFKPDKDSDATLENPSQFKRALRDHQRQMLTWMLEREAEAPDEWFEFAREDISIPAFQWQVEMEAHSKKKVYGGVVADEVGSGKTTVAYALAAADLVELQGVKPKLSAGKIASNATVVLVPKNILDQWETQAKFCFSDPEEVILKISTVDDFLEYAIEDFTEAKIILVAFNIFIDGKYWEGLRRLCCAPNVPTQGGRALEEWMEMTLKTLENLSEESDRFNNDDKLESARAKWMKGCARYEQFEGFKTRAVAKLAAKTGADGLSVLDPNRPQQAHPDAIEDIRDGTCLDLDFKEALENFGGLKEVFPLLHMFAFRRVIVDEFTYLTPRAILAILQLRTQFRWVMSGTPPLSTFKGVNTMAGILDTKISQNLADSVLFGFGGSPAELSREQSHAERFISFSNPPSDGCIARQNELAVNFVNIFLRQNPASTEGTHRKDHYILTKPSALERASYFESFLLLSSQTMKFNQKKLPKDFDELLRRDKFRALASLSPGPEAALLCAIAQCTKVNPPATATNAAVTSVIKELKRNMGELLTYAYQRMRELFAYEEEGSSVTDTQVDQLLTDLKATGDFEDGSVTEMLDMLAHQASTDPERSLDLFLNKREKEKVAKEKAAFDKGHADWAALKKTRRQAPVWTEPDITDKLVSDTSAIRTKETSARVTDLRSTVKKLVTLFQAVRFLESVRSVVMGKDLICCDCGSQAKRYDELYIAVGCGHAICTKCYINPMKILQTDDNVCRLDRCGAKLQDQQLIFASMFGDAETSFDSRVGTKMEVIASLIAEKTVNEYVVVFFQYWAQKQQLLEALEKAGIPFEDGSQDAKTRVPNFRKGAMMAGDYPADDGVDLEKMKTPYKGRVQPKVLLLKIDSADAAGW